MSQPTKNFSFYRSEELPPVQFVLNGQVIRCHPSISGMTLLKFVAASSGGDGGAMSSAILDFLKAVVYPEDWPKFDAVASDPRSGVGPEQLGEIAGWLSEAYTGRPTEGSSPSSAGSPMSGPGPMAISSTAPAPIYVTSTQ